MNIRLIFVAFFCFNVLSITAQDEDVNVVIATGLEMTQASAMSPDNKFVAQALYNVVSIWDVKTGRLLRKVPYVENLSQTTDSIWFSADSKKLIVSIIVSNDVYEIDIASGKNTFVQGEPFDYSNYTYAQKIRTASALYLYQHKSGELVYPAPGGNAELVYKIIPNPLGNSKLMPTAFQTHLRINGKLTEPLDTVFQANFAFSQDSKYVFAESDIYDLSNGRNVSKLKLVPTIGNSVMFLPGSRTPVTTALGAVRVWDFPHVEDVKIKDMANFVFSEDGKTLICARFDWNSGKREFIKLDLEKRKIVGKGVKTEETAMLQDVSPDGDFYLFTEISMPEQGTYAKYTVKLCQASTGKVIKVIPNTSKAYFTPDKNILLIDSLGITNKKYNLETGEVMDAFTGQHAAKWAYQVSSNHKYLFGNEVLRTREDKVMISRAVVYDLQTENEVFSVELEGSSQFGFNMSKDESKIAFSTSQGHVIYVYDFNTKKLIHELKGHNGIVEKTTFSDDGLRLISSSLDGTRRVWNLEKGHEMVSLINTGHDDYAIVTPSQYYYATKGAKKLIHFVKGIEIFPFSQFDLKYNRPDIIIQNMEASNQELIKPFYYAYQKRLKRMGFTEEMLDGTFHMPTASIDNTAAIPITTSKKDLTLHLSAQDDLYKLDRLLVRVNEVPIHGKEGISFRRRQTKGYHDEMTIELSKGRNLIEVSVLNEKGVESIASNVVVQYEPDVMTKPDLYLYTIGVSEYKQSDFNLTYAAKDAGDITSLFNTGSSPFNSVIAHQLTNENVTIEKIQEIKEELKQTNVDDAICIFYAGHGILDVELDYYLASHDIDFKDPATRGIPYDVFEDLLDNVPARKKLIMIDACHSGEIDKDEVALIESENSSENNEDIIFRSVNSTALKQVGLNNSFELMKELFNDLKKTSGAVIISSAGGMEYAMEGGEWNNGVFTYSFLRGIIDKKADLNEDGKIMLSEMNIFVRDEVDRLTQGKQHPTNRAEILESDWRLW